MTRACCSLCAADGGDCPRPFGQGPADQAHPRPGGRARPQLGQHAHQAGAWLGAQNEPPRRPRAHAQVDPVEGGRHRGRGRLARQPDDLQGDGPEHGRGVRHGQGQRDPVTVWLCV
eukprot:6362645-Prymnesium_polylepis.1